MNYNNPELQSLLAAEYVLGMLRGQAAIRFALLYGSLALVAFMGSVWLAGWSMIPPLLLALPFGLIFLWYDHHNQSRSWQAELTAPIAFSAIATCIALIDGWSIGPAYALWVVLVARAIPSILYVRSRIRLDRGRAWRPADS